MLIEGVVFAVLPVAFRVKLILSVFVLLDGERPVTVWRPCRDGLQWRGLAIVRPIRPGIRPDVHGSPRNRSSVASCIEIATIKTARLLSLLVVRGRNRWLRGLAPLRGGSTRMLALLDESGVGRGSRLTLPSLWAFPRKLPLTPRLQILVVWAGTIHSTHTLDRVLRRRRGFRPRLPIDTWRERLVALVRHGLVVSLDICQYLSHLQVLFH